MASKVLQETLRQLVTANHILHFHGAVDGFGHISVRNPDHPDIYIMCGYMPPASVESTADLVEYYVDGSDPVDLDAQKGYSERFIHGEIFKRYPEVQCVVHSHAEAVIPYVTSTVPLIPVYHMSGFMGSQVPVWDIAPDYDDAYQHDMLVNNERLGASLARAFCDGSNDLESTKHNVVLMKHHGYTTHGKDIPTAVYRTIYTLITAGILTNALSIQAAAKAAGMVATAALTPMGERFTRDCQKMTEATQDKAWRLWCKEVEASPLYKNRV